MSITSIQRDQSNVCIVRIESSDNIATISSANYILHQSQIINDLNNGVWEWLESDFVYCAASDSNALFQFTDDTFSTLIQYGAAGSGNVNPGLANQLAYYPISGDSVSGLSSPVNLNQGGTNASLIAIDGGVFVSNATGGDITDSELGGVFVSDNTGTPFFLENPLSTSNILLSQNGNSPIWSANIYPSATSGNQLIYTSSDFVVTGLASVNSASLITSSAGVPHWTTSLTNGQIVIGSTGASPVPGIITSSGGGTTTNAAGSITISPFVYVNVTSTTQIPIPPSQNIIYTIDLVFGQQANFLLPPASPVNVGQILMFVQQNGGFIVNCGSNLGGQRIAWNGATSVLGPGGSIRSSSNNSGFNDVVTMTTNDSDSLIYVVTSVIGSPVLT